MELRDLWIAVLLDLCLGDPYAFPHPVKAMGTLIAYESQFLLKRTAPGSSRQVAGLTMALTNILLVGGIVSLFRYTLPPFGRHLFDIYGLYACISPRMLHYEARKVVLSLRESLDAGRQRLRYIVGRDTAELSEEEVLAATVETVAENTSDGVVAPLLYTLLFGVVGGYVYKMINTMDSMVGYRNETYEDLGRFPAQIDDVANWIPARLTALFIVLTSSLLGKGRGTLKTVLRDARKHLSPNAGYPESAIAGWLGIELGGTHSYFGKLVVKPTIGQKLRSIQEADVTNTIAMMYATLGWMVLITTLLQLL